MPQSLWKHDGMCSILSNQICIKKQIFKWFSRFTSSYPNKFQKLTFTSFESNISSNNINFKYISATTTTTTNKGAKKTKTDTRSADVETLMERQMKLDRYRNMNECANTTTTEISNTNNKCITSTTTTTIKKATESEGKKEEGLLAYWRESWFWHLKWYFVIFLSVFLPIYKFNLEIKSHRVQSSSSSNINTENYGEGKTNGMDEQEREIERHKIERDREESFNFFSNNSFSHRVLARVPFNLFVISMCSIYAKRCAFVIKNRLCSSSPSSFFVVFFPCYVFRRKKIMKTWKEMKRKM